MSFLFPRKVTVTRPTQPTGVGAVGYGGQMPSTEIPEIATAVDASIQVAKEHGSPDAKLPGDSMKTLWKIVIPAYTGVAKGTINTRDIITDELGVRYQVLAPYWNSLGYTCVCLRLET